MTKWMLSMSLSTLILPTKLPSKIANRLWHKAFTRFVLRVRLPSPPPKRKTL
jgi:hypothetical protein